MKFVDVSLVTLISAAAMTLPAFAQDAEFQLPEQCITASETGEMDHASMGHGGGMAEEMTDTENGDLSNAPEHVQENMRKMMITMPAMEQGMMIEDPDVAFACAMIAHHQGAIDMARVLLEHGDDPEMVELAQDIMDAQVGEIETMTNWLAENAN